MKTNNAYLFVLGLAYKPSEGSCALLIPLPSHGRCLLSKTWTRCAIWLFDPRFRRLGFHRLPRVYLVPDHWSRISPHFRNVYEENTAPAYLIQPTSQIESIRIQLLLLHSHLSGNARSKMHPIDVDMDQNEVATTLRARNEKRYIVACICRVMSWLGLFPPNAQAEGCPSNTTKK